MLSISKQLILVYKTLAYLLKYSDKIDLSEFFDQFRKIAGIRFVENSRQR